MVRAKKPENRTVMAQGVLEGTGGMTGPELRAWLEGLSAGLIGGDRLEPADTPKLQAPNVEGYQLGNYLRLRSVPGVGWAIRLSGEAIGAYDASKRYGGRWRTLYAWLDKSLGLDKDRP